MATIEYLTTSLATTAGILVGSISLKGHRPRSPARADRRRPLPRPKEAEKHRLIMELLSEVDSIRPETLSPAAAHVLREILGRGTEAVYRRTEETLDEIERRVVSGGTEGLNESGLYRTALRLAILGMADESLADLKKEIMCWGLDEIGPMASAGLGSERAEARRASGIAVPITLG